MALDTEIGGAGTDSYPDLADIAAYAVAHGKTFVITGGTNEADAEAAARRGTLFIDSFRSRFPGARTNGRSQAREWPRTGATDADGEEIADDEIPAEIIAATCEAAILEKATPGVLAPNVTPGQIKKSVSVEGAVSVEYAIGSGSAGEQIPVVTVIEGILEPLLGKRGSATVPLLRM
ncbi:MAG: hypothetical protein LOX97_08200 [Sphingomonas sp.]|nr:hypothetical protein [Sphingomonas sp.]